MTLLCPHTATCASMSSEQPLSVLSCTHFMCLECIVKKQQCFKPTLYISGYTLHVCLYIIFMYINVTYSSIYLDHFFKCCFYLSSHSAPQNCLAVCLHDLSSFDIKVPSLCLLETYVHVCAYMSMYCTLTV